MDVSDFVKHFDISIILAFNFIIIKLVWYVRSNDQSNLSECRDLLRTMFCNYIEAE